MAQIIPIRPDAAGTTPVDAGPAKLVVSAERAQIEAALKKVADLINQGETWALPFFVRIENELETLTEQEDALSRALRIAQGN